MERPSFTRHPQAAACRSQRSPGAPPPMPIAAATMDSARAVPASGSGAIEMVTTSSLAARMIASARCEGMLAHFSRWSK